MAKSTGRRNNKPAGIGSVAQQEAKLRKLKGKQFADLMKGFMAGKSTAPPNPPADSGDEQGTNPFTPDTSEAQTYDPNVQAPDSSQFPEVQVREGADAQGLSSDEKMDRLIDLIEQLPEAIARAIDNL